jgi:hypothetical protein
MRSRLLAILCLQAAAVACTTAGVTERELSTGAWEIRAWDGDKCDGGTSLETCEKALRPVIAAHAEILCGGHKPKEISNCQRKDAVSGDRLYCYALCDRDGSVSH